MPATATQIANGTLVRNTSGGSRLFGFIGDRGKTLAANEVALVPGDFPNSILTDHRRNRRDYDAALDAIAAGRITLIAKPQPGGKIVTARVDSATVIAIGDMVYLDTDDVKPASAFTWDTNIATTQAGFAAVFLGIAVDASANGETTPIRVDISPERIWTMTLVSQTLEVGKTLGPAKAAGNALLSQTLDAAVAASAIARSTEYAASAQTSGKVVFASAFGVNTGNVNANIG